MFDPQGDGPCAIRGGCIRCQDLQAIFDSHQRTLTLMRTFAPPNARRHKPADPDTERQQELFGFLK